MIDPELQSVSDMLDKGIDLGNRESDIAYISIGGMLVFIGGGDDEKFVRYRLERLDP